jgi:hypothetical protein
LHDAARRYVICGWCATACNTRKEEKGEEARGGGGQLRNIAHTRVVREE